MKLRKLESGADPGVTLSPGGTALGFAAALVLLGALQTWYWSWTVDDAYITYRYAENLAAGHGAVFNPGERVEGYTNFLWMLLLAGFHAGGIDTEPASKVLGALCGAGTVLLTLLLARRLSGDRWTLATLAAPVLLASTPTFAAWTVAGLETPLFTLLLLGSVLRFSYSSTGQPRCLGRGSVSRCVR